MTAAVREPSPVVMRPAIERLLRPRSIALAGVSASPGSLGGIVLDNLERFAFDGAIHLLHPNRDELRGRPCFVSPAMLPFGVDCVVLAIPVAGILAAVRECAANGVGGVVIFSAGFAELGPEGRALQDEIAEIARAAGMVIEGPNCLGFVNYVDGVPLTFAVTEPAQLRGPGVAVASQSGAMASVVRAAIQARGLDVTIAASTGNEAATGLEDFLAYLLDDPMTRVVAIVAEHIRDPRRFLSLADRARAAGIMLLLLHPGRSQPAAEAAQTHTGVLTGDHAVMMTLVKRHGVQFVESLEDLTDQVDCLLRCPVRPRGGLAVLGESGAFKALILDQAEKLVVDLPQPEGTAQDALNAISPGFIVSSNPLDLTAQALGDPTLYSKAMDALLAHPRCGSLLVTIILTSSQMAMRKMPPVIAAMRAVAKSHAVVFAMLGEDTEIPQAIIDEVRDAGIPFFRSPERALRALAGVSAWCEAKVEQPRGADTERLPPGVIPEYRAKDILQVAGLPVPQRRLVQSQAQAEAAAMAIGYPVALKIQSAALSHKSDIGGVVLGLGDAAALAEGWRRLHANLAAAAPDVAIDGILVERMSRPGLELIVGARTDPDWGPVIVLGLGGVLAEALGDVRVIAADLDAAEIAAELLLLKGAALLGPFRGMPARDIDAIAAAVAKLGRFLHAHPEIAELDINPLMAFAEGEGVLALDALIACR